MTSTPSVEYLPDSSVDDRLDRELRDLLTACFTDPDSAIFQERRYARELPQHRWVIRTSQGEIIAHVAAHEKVVEALGRPFRVGGISEVCVHPDFRGRGFVKTMLAAAHKWLASREFSFAVLGGDSRVYRSSGYVEVQNLLHDSINLAGEKKREPVPGAMAYELSPEPWPSGEAFLPGLTF